MAIDGIPWYGTDGVYDDAQEQRSLTRECWQPLIINKEELRSRQGEAHPSPESIAIFLLLHNKV